MKQNFDFCNVKIMNFYLQLTTLDPDETFKSLKLYPQETVILEER